MKSFIKGSEDETHIFWMLSQPEKLGRVWILLYERSLWTQTQFEPSAASKYVQHISKGKNGSTGLSTLSWDFKGLVSMETSRRLTAAEGVEAAHTLNWEEM